MKLETTQFKNAWPYQENKMDLPVADVETSLPFYEAVMGFEIISRDDKPVRNVVLQRDSVQIGLAENGGDPTQDGCFFEVENLDKIHEELTLKAVDKKSIGQMKDEKHGGVSWRVFYVIAPDGLCYCLGERKP
jgi:lactoylglutathione lyase